ncbi:MAG: hypothetical protein RL441_1709, partial [Actinomycetota bacterium]
EKVAELDAQLRAIDAEIAALEEAWLEAGARLDA